MTTPLERVFLTVSVAIVLGIGGLFAFWLLWPYEVIIYPSDTIEVLNPGKEVPACTELAYQAKSEHLTDGVRVEVSRELINSTIINYPKTGYVTERGPFSGVNRTIVIPCFAPPGPHVVRFVSEFHVNPLRTITTVRQTEQFMVTPPTKEPTS